MVTGVSAQSRMAVFVRKCLDEMQRPNAAQVLMAVRGAFIQSLFVSKLSVCQWLSEPACVCICERDECFYVE